MKARITSTKVKYYILLGCIPLLIAVIPYSYFHNSKDVATNCRLTLSASIFEDYGSSAVIVEELDDKIEENINFLGCENVTVEINGEVEQLASAIRDKLLSFQQIWLFAQEDAENGFCTTTWINKNGLAKFCFQYPQVDLWLTNDIYKTPDGKEHHIRSITVCKPGTKFNTIFTHKDTGERIDLENWEVQLTASEVSPSGITFHYLQSSNQVIGQLYATHFEIYKRDPFSELVKNAEYYAEDFPIMPNVEIEHSLSWEKKYGLLDSGDYTMYLYLTDTYEEREMCPLSNNFYDTQVYAIEFTIP